MLSFFDSSFIHNCFYNIVFKFFRCWPHNKKRDCNVAVPLLKALVLPSIPNKQHWSPRRMYICTRKCVYMIIHTMSILVSHCFGIYEFTRFWVAKTKRVRRFLYVKKPHFMHCWRQWKIVYAIFDRKGTKKYWYMQIIVRKNEVLLKFSPVRLYDRWSDVRIRQKAAVTFCHRCRFVYFSGGVSAVSCADYFTFCPWMV